MKTLSRLMIVAVVLSLSLPPLAADAAGKGKKKGPPAAAAPNPANPTEALAPYINNIDQLLALDRDMGKAGEAAMERAPGRLVTLRASFVEQRDKAGEADRGKFEAAIVTCDVISKALDERAAVLGNLNASSAVTGSGKLNKGPRKDNLTQGIKGGDRAKAVGAIVERDREKGENKQAKVSAARSDNALTAMAANNWNKRSAEWRRQISEAYSRIK